VFGLTKSSTTPSTSATHTGAGGTGEARPLSDAEIAALVTLLERESKPGNVAIVRARLEELGSEALRWLDAASRERGAHGGAAAALATQIRRRALAGEWERWVESPDPDLEQGVLLIDRFGDPLREPATVTQALNRLAEELGGRLAGATDAKETLARLRTFLFTDLGFQGNTECYEDPQNSYLSDVLARRRGIPVSLSVVMLLLARRLRLPIVGIGMPGHFLVRFGSQPSGPYVDAFGGGRILTREDCAAWLRASGFAGDSRLLLPVGSRYIVARMLRNLVATFTKRGASSEAQTLTGYLKRVLAVSESDTVRGIKSRALPDQRQD
jgi:regulator of sirC expression with transglutaminase-like and TPR domain